MIRRFEDDITGITDSQGNAMVKWRGMTGESATLSAIGVGSGFPAWQLALNSNPVAVGRGPNAPMWIPLLHPGDVITMTVTGAVPNSAIRVHLTGYAAPEAGELVPLLTMAGAGGAIAQDVGARATLIGTLQTGGANTPVGPTTFPVPPGTQSIGFLVWQGSLSLQTPAVLKIQGAQSGHLYFNYQSPPPATGGAVWAPFGERSDSQVICSLTSPGAGGSRVDFFASPVPAAVDTSPASQSSPALWQAGNGFADINATIANGGTLGVIAGVGGQTVRFFGVSFTASGVISYQDTNGVEFGTIAANATHNSDHSGTALAVGLGFQLHNASGAPVNVNGLVSFSQG